MKKIILTLGVMLALLAVLAMPMATFAANDTPAVTVTTYASDGTTAVTSMTPGTEYNVKVHVTDADGITNLNTITLKVWYDADGGTPTEAEFDAITAGDAETAIIYTWTEGGTFSFTEESGSSWAPGASSAPADLSGDFQFKFTVGKVANETTGSANWQIASKVSDDDPHTVFAYDSDTATNDMDFYSEIAVTAGSVNWGTVTAGMDFAEGGSSEEDVGNITYIANGSFNKKVSTTSNWGTATLDSTGNCSSANQFSLKADDTGTLSTAVLVDTTGATIGSGTNNGESGTSDATNGLWLKLASTFAGGTFSGTITYNISK